MSSISKKRSYVQSSASMEKAPCQYCQQSFAPRGLKSHEASCARKREKKKRSKEFSAAAIQVADAHLKAERRKEKRHRLQERRANTPGPSHPCDLPSTEGVGDPDHSGSKSQPTEGPVEEDANTGVNVDDAMSISGDSRQRASSDTTMASIPGPVPEDPVPASADAPLDSFKTEYHPKSGRATITESFSAFSRSYSTPQPIDDEPWQPFLTSGDFEFAELAHKAALTKDQTNKLLAFIQRVRNGEAALTFKSHSDVSKAWDRAAAQMTPFEKHIVPVQHKKQDLEYEMYIRPLWDWAMDLLQDPFLSPFFTWDAQRLYKHNGTRFERFIDEPWTADRWWKIQSALPENGVPFAFILYADKSHLSSSGKVKSYPVIARCGNLPVGIRNGNGIGGGRLVGWLPIVAEDADESGKLSFTNLKRVVWHESFLKLLDSIILLSKTGFSHSCFDEIVRWLYPIILILSADYEEQCVMALIRGTNSDCPCPICLIPSTKLYDHSTTHPLRRAEEAMAQYELYKKSHAAAEEYLKKQGWRPVANAFWRVRHSDTAHTLCFDVLHFDDLGLWGRHLFGELKRLLDELGRHAEKTVDEQHDAFPRWRNFNHFKSVTNISFSDGNKFSDISKQILFTAQNVLTREESPLGYALLQCIASYMEYHMYITLDVHTESTLAAGEEGLLAFQRSLEKYIAMQDPKSRKSWNFPKAHLGKHAFRDILEKGAARNFSTRPNESVHGPIRHLYLHQTNRKNAAEQILRLDHVSLVSEFIRSRMDHLDQERLKSILDCRALEDDETETLDDRPFSGHIYLGSPLSPVTFAQVEETTLPVFQDFRKKFTQFINIFLPANDIPLPNDRSWFRPSAQEKIQEFRYLKVNYESHVDWKLATDYLRCNPCFHGRERYDYVLIRSHDRHQNEKLIFARLLFMFRYTVSERTLDLALVLPMDVPSGPRRTVDKDLHFKRLRARASTSSEFIPLQSVVRGALLVPDFKHDGDFFLVNYVDGDMFLRSKKLDL
ncbi:hypothetical protein BU15DRAFT_68692 [Melanogaster broomeanus]|nr:hypothetical protein BU15DRAFT_68692 [Melanogaster broomeanus]